MGVAFNDKQFVSDDHAEAYSGDSPSEGDIWLMSKIWGSYIGQVIVDHWGGNWGDPMLVGSYTALTLDVGDIQIVPTVKVYKRLTNGPEDNIWTYYKVLKSKFQEHKK